MIAAEDASFMAGEVVEQPKLRGRSRNHAAAHRQRHRGWVDFDFAYFHRAWRQRAFEAAKNSFHASHEFTRAEGLGDVVVSAEFEAENPIRFAALGCEKNNWNGREAGSLPNAAADFETVFAWDHDVENEQRGALAFGICQYSGSGWVDADDEAFVLEVMANKARNIGIVFDYVDAGFHTIILAFACARYLVFRARLEQRGRDFHQTLTIHGPTALNAEDAEGTEDSK